MPVVSSISPFLHVHSSDLFLQIPFWALVSFGAYLLAKLGYGVFSFNDVPEAHEELVKQIEQARVVLTVFLTVLAGVCGETGERCAQAEVPGSSEPSGQSQ